MERNVAPLVDRLEATDYQAERSKTYCPIAYGNSMSGKSIIAVAIALIIGFGGGLLCKGWLDHKNPETAVKLPQHKMTDGELQQQYGKIANHLWDVYMDPLLIPVGVAVPPVPFSNGAVGAPQINTTYGVNDVYVVAQVPGMTEKDVQVRASDQSVTISGSAKRANNFEEIFDETIELSCKVDASKMTKSFNNGVLTVSLPKA